MFRSILPTLLLMLFSGTIAATPIDINGADADVIAEVMTGVGHNKAQAIVRYRQRNGPFNRIEELANVRGIGRTTIERNRSRITTRSN